MLTVVIGHFTLLIELYRIAGAVVDEVDRAFVGAVICVLRAAPVMNLALLVGIGAALVWFVLSATVRRIEAAEASVLLAEGGAS